jgi:hypothetical protein
MRSAYVDYRIDGDGKRGQHYDNRKTAGLRYGQRG